MRYPLFAIATLIALPLHAAEISVSPGAAGLDVITVSGTINVGDEAAFRKLAVASDRAVVVLNSGGGNLKAGLEIGKAIRLSGFATAAAPDALCASACALTWLAGLPRLLDLSSKVGFHAAYRLVEGRASENGAANALVGAYLNQLGLGEKAVVFVTTAPPEGIEWLTPEKASAVSIPYETIAANAPSVSKEGSPLPNDPMSATTAFYAALAAADGEAAAALVVPAKRGRGPFNEGSIRAFYSAMSKSLSLTGTTRRGPNQVLASYEYTTDKGRVCRGRAEVQTVYQYGRTLISQIKALDGC